MVEFALVLIPMMVLLLGAIQFGVIWAAQVGVTNAVRDAARAASGVQPKALGTAGTIDATSERNYADSINASVLTPGLRNNVPFFASSSATKSICYSTFTDEAGAPALRATATVTYAHAIFIPLLSTILGSSINTTTTLSIPVGLDLPYTLPSAPFSAGTTPGVGTTGC